MAQPSLECGRGAPRNRHAAAAAGGKSGLHSALLATTALALSLSAAPAWAQTAWTGASSTDWFDHGNWDAGAPSNATDATIDTVANNLPTLSGGNGAAIDLFVGLNGIGTLTVENGGNLFNEDTFIGQNVTGVGSALLSGTNASWTSSGALVLGNLGTGSMTVQNGAILSSGEAFLGAGIPASGTMFITGNGTLWTNTGLMTVGGLGSGTVDVLNGAGVVSGAVDLGANAHANAKGTINLSGGSTWESDGFVTIGRFGEGRVNVLGGARMTSWHTLLAEEAGSKGGAVIGDAGSLWDTGNIRIGGEGEAAMLVHNGGSVEAEAVELGSSDLGSGMLTVDGAGSSLSGTGTMHVAGSGTGLLVITSGGVVNSHAGFIANIAGSGGLATIHGDGSAWHNEGALTVGNSGFATLQVLAGGLATSVGGTIGRFTASQASATVSGAGSAWQNGGSLAVGGEGNGALAITDGGLVSNGMGFVAEEADSVGTVVVSGAGSTWSNASDLFVGNRGNGALTLQDGGSVTAIDGLLGAHAGSLGTVTATGTGTSWTNTGDLYVGGEGEGRLTVASGALVDVAGTAFIGMEAGSIGTLNIGAAAGLAPLAAGQLNAAAVSFGAGTGTLVFNHTSTDHLFAPAVEGNGTIDLLAGRTRMSADSSGFSGQTEIADGATLAMDGSLGGTLDVLNGGRLEGTGTVGTTLVAGGGTVAPGNSIGTLNVAGDITFDAGSTYEVEVDPAGDAADLIHATGKAILNGGAVAHIGLAGAYLPFKTYEIITADAGVDGTFDGVTSDFAFLDPTLTYDPDSVFLTLVRNDVTFCAIGITPNQCATGEGVESLGPGTLHDALVLLDAETARDALDQMSGEVHASAAGVFLDDSRFVRDAASDRVRTAFGDVAARPAPALGFAKGDAPAVEAERLALWGRAFGAWGTFDGDGNAATLERGTGGVLIGGDIAAFDTWRLGLIAGYSRSSFDVDARHSSGDSDNLHLGLYGGTRWGALGLRFGAVYAWHDIETRRSVAFPGISDTLEASYDAGTAQVFGELGYRIDTAAAAFEPFAALAHVRVDGDGFTETGGAAALSSAGADADATFATLGLRAERAVALGGIDASLHGMVGWRHAFGDTTPTAAFAFAGGDAFTIAGTPIARNSAMVEAGIALQLSPLATLGVSYSGQFASGISDHAARADLAVRF
ncbi:autotransporter domain-containing protein [Nitratireductor pacificus]|uniref:Outer membrane autotransporter barrel domain-containing protein n=1 Tax=Nitratireductor pacificus pht-3B TaxID=391937 RepID=K2M7G2_9HYPH|nr:autotransporter domain-containing protein [Nitratireductor pacificus]EKF16950.1 outer membrane autotransporter barrel domain-containing protein [Nitratireductor pacificus pht-3B]